MVEFWAVIGRICVDGPFHATLFDLTDPTASFEEFEDLRKFLWSNGLRLSRWEVMNLNRIVSQEWNGTRIVYFRSITEDQSVQDIRSASGSSTSFPFPDKMEFCAVVGLSCIDTKFRDGLYAASGDLTELEEFLNPGDGGPSFNVGSDLPTLKAFMEADQMLTHLERFHVGRWVQPIVEMIFGACEAGSTKKKYLHLSQQDMALFLSGRQDGGALLKELKVAKALV